MFENNICLSIGGFNFKVLFSPTTLPFEKEIICKQIVSHYKGFITSLSPGHSADRTITFVDEKHFHVFKRPSLHYTAFYFAKQGEIFTYYHISLSQFTLLIVNLIQNFLQDRGFILHASGVCISKKAFLFTGPSGTGKSTISQILSHKFGQLADDSIIIRKENGIFYAYQTPLIEKNTHSFTRGKGKYPLEAVFFLKKTRGKPSLASPPQKISNIPRLANQMWLNRVNKKQMKILISLISSGVGIFELSFPKDLRTLQYFKRLQHDLRSQPGPK